jgi:hypothetical protein
MTPPNTMALKTSVIVGNIPFMPPVAINEVAISSPISILVFESKRRNDVIMIAVKLGSASPHNKETTCGCNKNIQTNPRAALTESIRSVLQRAIIIMKVIAGTIKHIGDTLNTSPIA